MQEAILYKQLKNGIAQCQVCSWQCQIKQGETGLCGARKNISGKLMLIFYNRASAIQLDPIEKKPLYHFLPGKKVLSIGSVGCNFACEFCQNFEISQFTKDKNNLLQRLGKDLNKWGVEISKKKIIDYCLYHNIPAIAFTYNEPTIFAENAAEIMAEAKTAGLKGVFVSNGFMSEQTLQFLSPYIDAYNIDLKSFNENFYRKICHADLAPVLKNLKKIYEQKKWLEITTLLIPNENDSAKEIKQMAQFIKNISADIPWHLTAFYPAYHFNKTKATSQKTLEEAYQIAKKCGLSYVYLGNLNLPEKYQTTFCAKCQKPLIQRKGYQIEIKNLINGCCGYCGSILKGIWN